MTSPSGSNRALPERKRDLRFSTKVLSPGDLVFVHEVFDEEDVEWITHDGCALVIEVENVPAVSPGFDVCTTHRLVTVLVDGKIVDDYFENELTPV